MPVTAKLSKKLYDTLGEDLANELVEWFNQVDSTYQTNLRELNDLNFQRFDAKLEQGLVQFDAKLERRLVQFDAKLDRRLVQFEAKLDRRLVQFEAKWDEQISGLRSEISELRVSVNSQISELRAELIKWMFLFWLGTVATVLGFVSLIP